MQHGHHPFPSPHLSTTVSQQHDSQRHLSTPPHHVSSHSHRSPFQTNFPAPPSSHLINDPTSHSSSRRSIPSPPQNQQYHQPRFSTDFNPPQNHNHYQPYPGPTNDPFFHQSRYPANNEASSNPNCPPVLYMHTPPPTHPPHYPYHTPPPIPTQPNPDHLHQYPHQHPHPPPPPTMLPPPPVEQVRYPDNHNTHQAFPAHPVPQVSSGQTHVFGNENTLRPTQSIPGNPSILRNTSKPPDNSKPVTSLPPLRNPPSRVANQSFYPMVQGVQNMNAIMPPSRSVLPSVPYHPPQFMSPNIPPQNLQRVPDAAHFYSNPYHHNVQTGLPTEQHYQRAPVNNLQWQPNLAPAAHARSATDGSDDTFAFPSYYVGPDGVTRYISQQVTPRKKRLQWTPELHAKFVKAVEEFGVETAVPKMLLQAMNVPGLTRENVASHLQKYRESIRKRKLEVERSNSGVKMDSKELDRSKLLSSVEAKDDMVDGGRVEAKADEDKRSSEREDSSKRLRDIEGETSGKTNSKRQKSVSNTQEGEAVKESGVTEREVESYARVRARVDEALQLQAFRNRQRDKEPDVT